MTWAGESTTTSSGLMTFTSDGSPGSLVGSQGQVILWMDGQPVFVPETSLSGTLPLSPDDGDILIAISGEWTRLPIGGSGTFLSPIDGLPAWTTIEGVAENSPACQVRRTSGYTLTGSFADVTLDTTDVETDANVLEHNGSSTDRIDIKEDALYLLYYHGDWNATASDTFDCRSKNSKCQASNNISAASLRLKSDEIATRQ